MVTVPSTFALVYMNKYVLNVFFAFQHIIVPNQQLLFGLCTFYLGKHLKPLLFVSSNSFST